MRLKPADLCMAEAMPFQQHHECRVAESLAEALGHDFFGNVRANLRPGDLVTVVGYEDDSWARVAQVAALRIVESGETVRYHLVGGIEDVAAAEAAGETEPVAHYSDGTWTVARRGNAKWCVLDGDGVVKAEGLDKKTADAVADGRRPLPEAA